MWDERRSDMVRLSQALEQTAAGDEGVRLYEKFNGTTQEPVRLAVALRGFFLPHGVTDQQRQVFGAYLKRRIRPAVEALIELEDLDRLQRLEQLGWFNGPLVDSFLQTAIRQRKSAVIVWLLQRKAQLYGYPDRDLSL